jgi:predicted ribosome quality control (RQC) complex YloA/Tae2 family protein
MKDQASAFDVAAVVKEMQILVGGFIDNIYQLSPTDIIVKVNIPNLGKKNLAIRNGEFVWLAGQEFETPKEPSSFAMLLRKHLDNGYIENIAQYNFDRIVEITIRKKEEYRLIIELFGEGNIILVMNSKIIQPLNTRVWKAREIKPGKEYLYPPGKTNPFPLSKEVFFEVLKKSNKDVVRTLATTLSLPGIYSEEICEIAGIEKNTDMKNISVDELERIYNILHNMINTAPEPMIIIKDGSVIDVVPFRLKKYGNCEVKLFPTFSEAIYEYLSSVKVAKEINVANEEVERSQRQYQQQLKTIEELKSEIEENRKKGEIIDLHYNECEEILKIILQAKDTHKNWDGVIDSLRNNKSVVEINPSEISVVVRVSHILDKRDNEKVEESEIKLDLRKTARENASYYYELAKKAKNRLKGAENAAKRTLETLKEISTKKRAEQKKTSKKAKTKTFWFEKFRWFISSDGYLVIGGKDAKSNEQVVKKHLSNDDVYVHADVHGAPSVVIKRVSDIKILKSPDKVDKLPNEKEGEEKETMLLSTLYEAAEFSLAFSKSWNTKIGSGDAYWVLPDQVSKTPQTGEFLAKGAFVIRGKRNIIHDVKIRAAIGEIEINGIKKMMCGPVKAVKMRCKRYIVFEPGETKKTDFANEIKKIFNVDVGEILKVLPPGDVKIVEKNISIE